MTDEQNQTLMRAFAVAGNRAADEPTAESFVATVAASVRRRRLLQWRLRLLGLGLLLLVAAVLAPLVASFGVWMAGAWQWLVAGAGSVAASPAGIVTAAALVLPLAFAAAVLLWVARRA